MTARQVRTGHCYRCGYSWRMRLRYPHLCPRCKSRLWQVPRIRPLVLGHGQGIEEVLGPHRAELIRIGRRHGALRFRVFGSVRRKEAGARSDVDLLVSMRRSASLLDFAALHVELEALLGRSVDLIEEGRLPWDLAPQIEAEAVVL